MFEEISCKKCVRVLPRIMTFTKGLARIVNLAGIRPLTLSVDFQLGMSSGNSTKAHQEMAANWSTYSQEFICKVLEQSQHKLALLTDWRQDVKKRIHGDLILLGFTKRISLSRLLVFTQHGDIFPDLIKYVLLTCFHESWVFLFLIFFREKKIVFLRRNNINIGISIIDWKSYLCRILGQSCSLIWPPIGVTNFI